MLLSESLGWPLRVLLLGAAFLSPVGARAGRIRHFVFFDLDRSRIHEQPFLTTKSFVGAQLKYTWRELEPSKGVYDFAPIRRDMEFLHSKGKTLFVQLQDVTFAPELVYVPRYMQTEAEYHGGANQQYSIDNNDEVHARKMGWVARRWDPAVQKRFHLLLAALGKAFDGKIEGINLPETAVDFGETGKLFPPDFTPAKYCQAVLENLVALKRAFPRSVTMLYANFMPGEWLPEDDKHYLKSVFQRARQLKVGVGGPDLQPFRTSQLHHSYPLIRGSHGQIPTGIAVQEGNYGMQNPMTGRPVAISDLMRFAGDYLKVSYVFWCTEEPYYSKKLVPFMRYLDTMLTKPSGAQAKTQFPRSDPHAKGGAESPPGGR